MAKYSSKPATLTIPIKVAFERISNLSSYKERIEAIPAEQREKMGKVTFTEDSITLSTSQIGELRFDITERKEPNRIVFSSANSPVPLNLSMDLTEKSASETEVVTTIDIEIPAMLRPMIGGKLQEAADKFTELFSSLNQQ